jgi:hypothetical protein
VLVTVDDVHRATAPLVERTVGHPEALERAEAQLREVRMRRSEVEVVGGEDDRLARRGDRRAMLCACGAPLGIRVLPEVGICEMDDPWTPHDAKYGR